MPAFRSPTVMRYLRSPLAGVFSRTSDDSPYTLPNLAAKYDLSLDASTTSSNIRIDSSNRVSLVADTSGNSAVNALVNNGGGGTATAPGKSVTGSFTITADVQLSTFVPAANLDLFNNQSGNTGLFFRLQTDGTLRLTVGDGATQTNAFSSATGLTANTRHTLSAVWVDGVGVTFQIDGVNHGTQQALAKTLASSGATATVCSGVIGAVYRVQCGSFYDFNPSLAAKLATQVVSGGDTWTVTTSGATGARISGARDLYQGTLASQPIYLAWSGTNYGYINGSNGNYFSTPDDPKYNPTTSLSIRVGLAADDWTPSGIKTLGAKFWAQYSWILELTTTSQLRFRWSTAGGSFDKSATSSTTASFTDLQFGAVRADLALATGNVTFYTSTDGVTWVQLGSVVTGAGATTVNDSTDPIEFLSDQKGGGAMLTGKLYFGQVYVDGVLQGYFNPGAYTSGTTFTASTGEVWTLNSQATVVTKTGIFTDASDDFLRSSGFSLIQPTSAYFIGKRTQWYLNGTVLDGSTSSSMAIQNRTGTPAFKTPIPTSGADNTNWPIGTAAVVSVSISGGAATSRVNLTSAVGSGSGSGNADGVTLGARGDSGASGAVLPAGQVTHEVLLYSVAHDTPTQTRVIQYEGRKWGISV
jgi:hypothetical protein